MQHTPFRHPLASVAAGTVLGHRRDGRPIYPIAGGNGEGEGAGVTPPAGDPTPPPVPPVTPPAGDTTDWKAQARKWEDRAKANSKAADDLAALQKQAMTDQEKAVVDAEAKGRTAAAADYGTKLAAAEFRAAVAAAGLVLGEAADLIDTTRFVGKDGEVDTDAITTAVKKLAKLAPARGAGRSGGDFGGGSGDTAASIDKQIADATAKRDFATVIRLKRQKAAQS
ncbi:hypothetical protein [Kitasatospora sp. P5_F3]